MPENEETALIVPEAEEGWAKVQASALGDRMKRALYRVACGDEFRVASKSVGYTGHQDVYRYAIRFGLVDIRTTAIINKDRRIADLAGAEIEVRLLDEKQLKEISIQQLGVIKGISTDKILAHDKASTDDGGDYISALEAMAARVVESGVEMELKVSIKPAAPQAAVIEAETIDVTPPKGA